MRLLKRNIPREIEIAPGVFYKIKWDKEMLDHDLRGEASSDGKIRLATGMETLEAYETLWHELLHSIEYEYEIKIPHELIYKLEKPLAFIQTRGLVWIDFKKLVK